MEENWLIIQGFTNPRDANYAAAELKSHGLACHTVVGEGGEWNAMGADAANWMFLEVKVEDYDAAIEILQIDPTTVEEVEASFTNNAKNKRAKRGSFVFWTSLISGVVVLRILADVI